MIGPRRYLGTAKSFPKLMVQPIFFAGGKQASWDYQWGGDEEEEMALARQGYHPSCIRSKINADKERAPLVGKDGRFLGEGLQ